MQPTEDQIKEKMDEMRSALARTGGMGLADDALSVSESSLRKLAIESLKPDPREATKKDQISLDPNAIVGTSNPFKPLERIFDGPPSGSVRKTPFPTPCPMDHGMELLLPEV